MSRRALLLAVPLLAATCGWQPAGAALSPRALATVGAHPAADASVPLALPASGLDGTVTTLGEALGHRPALLLLDDWRCPELCGSLLAIAGQAAGRLGELVPGRDFSLVAVGFNPAATAQDGRTMRDNELAAFPDVAGAVRLLTLPPDALDALEQALGFVAVRDADRFAHPADLYVLTPEGRVSRLLDGLTVDPDTLRLALVEAGQGRIGSLADRLHVLCYGLLPMVGAASGMAQTMLRVGAGLTLLAGGGGLLLLLRRRPARGG